MNVTADQVEAAIVAPAPGQLELFLDFEWLVPFADGEPWVLRDGTPFTVDYVFTRPERFEPLRAENRRGKEFEERPYPLTTPDGWNRVRPMRHQRALDECELSPVRGRDLFPRVLARGDYHTIHVNACCGTWDEPRRHGELRMPSGFAPLWVGGVDPRPEARILPARSIAEIRLAMQFFHTVHDPTHRLEYVGDTLAAIYEGTDVHDKPRRQAFALVTAQPDPRDFAPEVSEVLCGGLLAHRIVDRRWDLDNNFHEATRQALRDDTPYILRLIDEVQKMLDPSTDKVPPACFRFEFAPAFVKPKPHILTGEWLRETRRKFVEFVGA